MLLLPVTASAGSHLVYEMRNPWQRAWAQFQPGTSPIIYVRPSGSGGDSLLLTYGPPGRRSRLWWRAILDQFGAADVLVAVARLRHQFPGEVGRAAWRERVCQYVYVGGGADPV